MKWETVKLGDIAICIQPGPFGSQLHNSDYSEYGTPLIMPKDMIDGHISHSNLIYIGEEHVQRLRRHQVHTGNIMVARKGDVRKCVFITENEDGWMTGSDWLKGALDETLCHPKFIYYQLRSPYVGKWLETISIGATMPSLNTGLLSGIEVFLPPIYIQKKVSDILATYDDLIKNNQKQIKLLEEAAQRLYKEWFVDLRFPGYETTPIVDGIPEGWEIKTVGSIIGKVQRTTQIMTSDYLDKGLIPVIDQSREFIAGYTNEENALVNLGIPVIVFGDHTRILKYVTFPFAKGADGTQLIVSNCERMPQPLLYCSLVNVDLSNYHYARHFKYLKASEILVPSLRIADMFNNITAAYFEQIQCAREIIKCATDARDRLLPKLMSGEIEVNI